MTKNTLYTFCGDDNNDNITYIYRYDIKGNIYRALTTDDHYTRIDPAAVPTNIWIIFANAAQLEWQTVAYTEKSPVSWSIPENTNDTGITFSEFKELVLSICPNSFYDEKTFQFKMTMKTPSGDKILLVPSSTLRDIAERNRYFEDAPWR